MLYVKNTLHNGAFVSFMWTLTTVCTTQVDVQLTFQFIAFA